MSHILITGGAGFIGSSLADALLAQDHEVIVLDNFHDYYDPQLKENNVAPNLNNKSYHLFRGDINDKSQLNHIFTSFTIDTVIHLAARAGIRPSLHDPAAYVRTNVEGTAQILEAMRRHHVQKLIFASSSSVYGNCQAAKFSEDLPLSQPISPYAATKLAGEQLVYTYTKLYDLQAVCLRFFTVYGPRQRPDLAIHKFVKLIEQGRPIPVYGDGSTIRDYTYIDDIVHGIINSIYYNSTPYDIINLGGGSPVTLNEMIATLEQTLGQKAIIDRQPLQPGDVTKTVSDISKAQRLLNYQPQTTFTQGINLFYQWYKNLYPAPLHS
ncbi:SDR family NAD(P)-dependent oxidoreductase [bacterium]|nr:SDR family NAD(P)-dependent oxidoreductase [bacterium]